MIQGSMALQNVGIPPYHFTMSTQTKIWKAVPI